MYKNSNELKKILQKKETEVKNQDRYLHIDVLRLYYDSTKIYLSLMFLSLLICIGFSIVYQFKVGALILINILIGITFMGVVKFFEFVLQSKCFTWEKRVITDQSVDKLINILNKKGFYKISSNEGEYVLRSCGKVFFTQHEIKLIEVEDNVEIYSDLPIEFIEDTNSKDTIFIQKLMLIFVYVLIGFLMISGIINFEFINQHLNIIR